jgi:hypothetical protein
VLAGGSHVGLDAPVEQAVLVLGADEAAEMVDVGGPIGIGDLPAAEVGAADVADLALADQVVERREGLLDGGVGIGDVDLVEVDPVGPEPAQAGLDPGATMAASRLPLSAAPRRRSDSPAP